MSFDRGTSSGFPCMTEKIGQRFSFEVVSFFSQAKAASMAAWRRSKVVLGVAHRRRLKTVIGVFEEGNLK